MAILTISSDNPDLSWVIQKNPETTQSTGVPFTRELRRGTVYGWFCDPGVNQVFRLLFLDHPTESSFASGNRENFEYLDKTRYGHPYCAVQMVQEALSSASKPSNKETDKDVPTLGTIVSYDVCTHAEGLLKLMAKITEARQEKFSYATAGPGVYELRCESPTIIGALNLLLTVCLVLTVKDKEFYLPMNQAGVTKVLNVMERANSPYFIRHIFTTVAVNNRDMFKALKGKGLLGAPGVMDLQFGNTQQQRHDFIKKAFKDEGQKDRVLYDLGCGEMYHSTRLANEYYYVIGVDKEENLLETNQRWLKKKELTEKAKFVVEEVTPQWINSEAMISCLGENDILLTEVLEHMPKEEAAVLLQELTGLECLPNKIVLTVPNKNFNKHFPLADDEETRHWDHKWEPTPQEWDEFILGAVSLEMEVDVGHGGDVVEGDPLFLTAIITTKEST